MNVTVKMAIPRARTQPGRISWSSACSVEVTAIQAIGRLRTPDGTEEPFAPDPPPALGAHTDDALGAAGFSPDDIAALHADGAV